MFTKAILPALITMLLSISTTAHTQYCKLVAYCPYNKVIAYVSYSDSISKKAVKIKAPDGSTRRFASEMAAVGYMQQGGWEVVTAYYEKGAGTVYILKREQ